MGHHCQESGYRVVTCMGMKMRVPYWGTTAKETHASHSMYVCVCVFIQFANILVYRQLTLSLVSFSDNMDMWGIK